MRRSRLPSADSHKREPTNRVWDRPEGAASPWVGGPSGAAASADTSVTMLTVGNHAARLRRHARVRRAVPGRAAGGGLHARAGADPAGPSGGPRPAAAGAASQTAGRGARPARGPAGAPGRRARDAGGPQAGGDGGGGLRAQDPLLAADAAADGRAQRPRLAAAALSRRLAGGGGAAE